MYSEPNRSNDFKACPFCAETIKAAARLCRFCNSDLSSTMAPAPSTRPSTEKKRSSRGTASVLRLASSMKKEGFGSYEGHQNFEQVYDEEPIYVNHSNFQQQPKSSAMGICLGVASILLGAYAFCVPYFIAAWLVPAAGLLGLLAIAMRGYISGLVGIIFCGAGLIAVLNQQATLQHSLEDLQRSVNSYVNSSSRSSGY